MVRNRGMDMPSGSELFGDFFESAMSDFGFNNRRAGGAQDLMSAMMSRVGMNPMSMMMMDPFQSMQQAMMMAQNGNNDGFSYCSSSVTTYTTDENGRPQVYQRSNEVKQGPGGLKETKSALRDSRTGQQALEIGHHLNDKSYIKKKSKNFYTGEEEQTEDLVNLDEAEAETFEQNWMQQARNFTSHDQLGYGPAANGDRLAITSGSGADQQPCYKARAKQALNQASKFFKGDKKKRKDNRDHRHKWGI